MSLQTRLSALITAIGADIKSLKATAALNPAIVASAKRTADVALAVNWNGPVSFPTENVDSDGYWNGTRFQPTRAGWYRIGAQVAISGGTSGGGAELHLSKNATGTADAGAKTVADDVRSVRSDGWIKMAVNELVFFNGTTDYVEVFIFMGNTATLRGTSTANISTFNAESVGASGPTGAVGPQGPGTTILDGENTVSAVEQSGSAVEWRDGGSGGALLAKIVAINPIVSAVIVDRSELRLQVQSRSGDSVRSRLLLDSDGNSDFDQQNLMRYPGSFQDLTGTSAWNSPRQPNLTRATLVHLTLGGVANTQHSVYVGPNNPPTQRVAIAGGASESAAWRAHTIIVPPGYYYRYTQDVGAPNVGVRIEWTL